MKSIFIVFLAAAAVAQTPTAQPAAQPAAPAVIQPNLPPLTPEENNALIQYDYLIKSAQLELTQYVAALKDKYKMSCCEIGKISVVPPLFGFVQSPRNAGQNRAGQAAQGEAAHRIHEKEKPVPPEAHDKVKTPNQFHAPPAVPSAVPSAAPPAAPPAASPAPPPKE